MYEPTTRPAIAIAVVAALAGSIDTPAAALESAAKAPPAAPVALGEVIVTARRREEASSKVPIAITAFSSRVLAEQHISTNQDLQGQVPSLSVGAVGQSRITESFTVRGQGTSYQASPGVVTYLAEVPLVSGIYSSVQGGPGMMLDLANLQVLRGPQGTLFGRNTTGGAVLLEPAKPAGKFGGYAQFQVGNYNDHEFEGVLNVPVTDALAIRVAARSVDRDGYTRDVVTLRDYDDRHYVSGRLGVAWKPSTQVDNYLMMYGSRSHSHGSGYVNTGFNVPYLNGVFGAVGGCAGVGLGSDCSVLTALTEAQRARGLRHVSLSGELGERVSGYGVSDALDVHIDEHHTIRNIISYSELQAKIAEDVDGTPVNIYNIGPYNGNPTDRLNQFTEELQLQGDAEDGRLNYALGGYYERGQTLGEQGLATRVLLGQGGSLRGAEHKSYAVFAQTTYDFGALASTLDGLKLTGGFRYTWDSGNGFGSVFLPGGPTGALACTNGVIPVGLVTPMSCAKRNTYKSSAPSWTVGLDYNFSERALVYAKVTRGYKSGGVNFASVNPAAGNFRPELVTSYELGTKTRWRFGDIPASFNANVYKLDYKDIQRAGADFNPTTSSVGVAVFNAGAAKIKGVELEGTIEPVRGLQISGNYSYIDAKYENFGLTNPFGQLDCSGRFVAGIVDLSCAPFPNAPKNQYSLTGRYEIPLADGVGSLILTATYSYIGRQYTGTTALPAVEPGAYLESYRLVNFSANWNNAFGAPVDIVAFATNLTDETYRISNSNVFFGIGSASSLYGEPRMYGMQVRYHW